MAAGNGVAQRGTDGLVGIAPLLKSIKAFRHFFCNPLFSDWRASALLAENKGLKKFACRKALINNLHLNLKYFNCYSFCVIFFRSSCGGILWSAISNKLRKRKDALFCG